MACQEVADRVDRSLELGPPRHEAGLGPARHLLCKAGGLSGGIGAPKRRTCLASRSPSSRQS